MPLSHIITVQEAIAYMDALRAKVNAFGDPTFEDAFANKSFGGTIDLTDIAAAPPGTANISGLKGWLGYDKVNQNLFISLQYSECYDPKNPDYIGDMAGLLKVPSQTSNLFGWNNLAGSTFLQKIAQNPGTSSTTNGMDWKDALSGYRTMCEHFPLASQSHGVASFFFSDNSDMSFKDWLNQGTSEGTPIQKIRFFFGWDNALENDGLALRILLFPVNNDNTTTLTLADGSEVKAFERAGPPL